MAASTGQNTEGTLNHQLFEALNNLISPALSKPHLSEGDSEEVLLDSLLQTNLASTLGFLSSTQIAQELLEKSPHFLLQDGKLSFTYGKIITVRQKFTEVCIFLLHLVRNNLLDETVKTNQPNSKGGCSLEQPTLVSNKSSAAATSTPKLPPGALSIQQEKTICAALQFVVVLGLSPYLESGVGLPVSQRLGPVQILLATAQDYSTELGDLERIQHLIPVAKLFCGMLDATSLKELILNIHLTDILAVLIQLRHSARNLKQSLTSYKLDSTASTSTVGKTKNDEKMVRAKNYRQENSQKATNHSEKACKKEDVLSLNSDDTHSTSSDWTSIQSPEPVLGDKDKVITGDTISKNSQELDKIFKEGNLPEIYLDPGGHQWTLKSVIDYCNIEIDRAIRFSSSPLVLKTLMMLSGGSKNASGLPVKTPPWFRKTVAIILRDVLMVSPGVQHLINSFVGNNSSESFDAAQDWQKCKAVAHIISRCPVTPQNIKKFYASVSQQLISLIQSPKTFVSPTVVRAVGGTILELTNQQPALMHNVCFSHLFAPLVKISSCNNPSHSTTEGQIVVIEKILTSCVECLHRLFVVGQEPQSDLISSLQEVVRVLFSIFIFTRNGTSALRSPCKELVQVYLSHCNTLEGVTCIMALISNEKSQSYPSLHSQIALVSGPDAGVQAVVCSEKRLDIESWTQPVDAIMDILCGLKSESLTSQLFLHLLEKLTDIVKTESKEADVILPSRVLSPSQQASAMAEVGEKISLVSLLAAIGEKFGSQVVTSCQHVLIFLKATLERCVKICESSGDEATQTFEWETVSMAMGLLTAVLGGAVQMTEEDKKSLDELLPLLTTISDSDVADPAVKEMADDLKVAVATRGLVWAELSKMRSGAKHEEKKAESKPKTSTPLKKPLIEVLSETTEEEKFEKKSDLEGSGKKVDESNDTSKVTELEQAFQELCDPLLPVRGHGLISLARMVEDRHPDVQGKREMLLKVFLENLTHTDSYIYLSAVNGLAALSDLCPDQVIQCLTSEFRSNCSKDQGSKYGEIVLKVGEGLIKATKRLGDLTPKYRDPLLWAILCGCRHDNALVRASSLSGLAEVCRLLRFSIGPVLHEILMCCRDVLNSDPDPEPRKAAAMTLTLLLQGLGKDSLVALSDVLRDIYHVLKRSLNFDPDEKVKFHANLALNELDDIMREALFSKPEMKKTITVLGHQ